MKSLIFERSLDFVHRENSGFPPAKQSMNQHRRFSCPERSQCPEREEILITC